MSLTDRSWRAPAGLAVLLLLSLFTYARSLQLPLISDDYLHLILSRQYGPVEGWAALAGDALYRCRATSILLTYWTDRVAGSSALVLGIESIVLHALSAWMIFAFGAWKRIGWRLSFAAAAFFAIYQGHQEAVIWYAAQPELLLFLFALGTVWLWLRWLERKHWGWYAASLASFVLALLSKEAGVIVIPVLALVTWMETRQWRTLLWLAPFGALATVYVAGIFAARNDHLHFNDGTFSLEAPVAAVWARSLLRLFRITGMASLLVLAWTGAWREWMPKLKIGLGWAGLALIPYCFLTYMPHIPSRHSYLASAGLAVVVGAALLALYDSPVARLRQTAVWLTAVLVCYHCGYIWTRKHNQFLERAEPTEVLIRFAQTHPGGFRLHCFPYSRAVAETTLQYALNRPARDLLREDEDAPVLCFGQGHDKVGR